MSKDVRCPYCNEWQEINHDDGYGYGDEETYNQQCGKCDKTFVFTTSISFYYEAEKADCLNEGQHNWVPTSTFPREYARMCCVMCQEEREPTDEERTKYNLTPTSSPKQ